MRRNSNLRSYSSCTQETERWVIPLPTQLTHNTMKGDPTAHSTHSQHNEEWPNCPLNSLTTQWGVTQLPTQLSHNTMRSDPTAHSTHSQHNEEWPNCPLNSLTTQWGLIQPPTQLTHNTMRADPTDCPLNSCTTPWRGKMEGTPMFLCVVLGFWGELVKPVHLTNGRFLILFLVYAELNR